MSRHIFLFFENINSQKILFNLKSNQLDVTFSINPSKQVIAIVAVIMTRFHKWIFILKSATAKKSPGNKETEDCQITFFFSNAFSHLASLKQKTAICQTFETWQIILRYLEVCFKSFQFQSHLLDGKIFSHTKRVGIDYHGQRTIEILFEEKIIQFSL